MFLLRELSPRHNPLVTRALRSSRGRRRSLLVRILGNAFIAHLAAILIGVVWLLAWLLAPPYSISANYWERVATTIIVFTVLCLLIAMLILVPRGSIGAITQEREHQTLDVLLVTTLSERSIVWGKLVAAILDPLLMVVTVIPLLTLCTLVSEGITGPMLLIAVVVLLTVVVMFAAVGLLASTVMRTTVNATLLTYLLLLPLMLGGPFIIAGLIDQLPRGLGLGMIPRTFSSYMWGIAYSLNPLTALLLSLDNLATPPTMLREQPDYLLPPWLLYLISHIVLIWLMVQYSISTLSAE